MSTPEEPAAPIPGLDSIGWYIATTHQILGHAKASVVLGVDPGDPAECAICKYEATHSEADRVAVLVALAPSDEQLAELKAAEGTGET